MSLNYICFVLLDPSSGTAGLVVHRHKKAGHLGPA